MSSPIRIQRHRTAGWRMQEGAIYVGRPTGWGNPYRAGETCCFGGALHLGAHEQLLHFQTERANARCPDQATATAWYRELILQHPTVLERARSNLRGRDLCCWCALDQPCHADVLLDLANG